MNMKTLALFTLLLSSFSVFADEKAPTIESGHPYIAVGQAKARKTGIALPGFVGPANLKSAGEKALTTIRTDLLYMDSFQILDAKAYLDKSTGVVPGSFQMTNWSAIQAEFVFKAD